MKHSNELYLKVLLLLDSPRLIIFMTTGWIKALLKQSDIIVALNQETARLDYVYQR